MSVKQAIGFMKCALCDFLDGEVKEDKNDNPFFFCPECNSQIMTHGKQPKADLMRKKMRPVDRPTEAARSEPSKAEMPADKPKAVGRTMLG